MSSCCAAKFFRSVRERKRKKNCITAVWLKTSLLFQCKTFILFTSFLIWLNGPMYDQLYTAGNSPIHDFYFPFPSQVCHLPKAKLQKKSIVVDRGNHHSNNAQTRKKMSSWVFHTQKLYFSMQILSFRKPWAAPMPICFAQVPSCFMILRKTHCMNPPRECCSQKRPLPSPLFSLPCGILEKKIVYLTHVWFLLSLNSENI